MPKLVTKQLTWIISTMATDSSTRSASERWNPLVLLAGATLVLGAIGAAASPVAQSTASAGVEALPAGLQGQQGHSLVPAQLPVPKQPCLQGLRGWQEPVAGSAKFPLEPA